MNGWPVVIVSALFPVVFAGVATAQGGGMHHGMGDMGGGMCAGGCRMMDVTPEPIDPKSLPEPRSRGAKLLTTKCTQCHGVVTPRQHAASEWPSIVQRMDRRMRMMARGGMGMMRSSRITSLTAADKATLLDYLERNSFRAAPQAGPGEGNPAAQAYYQTCSRCHAPPDPSVHTPEEWNAVVARMAQHMEQQGFGLLPADDRELILRYLSNAPTK